MPNAVKLEVPAQGQKITISNGRLQVPDQPIVPFIEGDGTGADIWRASVRVLDAAVAKAYGGKRKIHWMEVYAGQKSNDLFNTWLPDETVAACREYLVSIKGPLTTPIGGGIRSLNVALRQMLDLYVCLRPVRWFKACPPRSRRPEGGHGDLPQNTEDIYAGIEFEAAAPTTRSSRICSGKRSRSSTARSASPTRPASASRPFPGRHRATDARGRPVRDRQQAQRA